MIFLPQNFNKLLLNNLRYKFAFNFSQINQFWVQNLSYAISFIKQLKHKYNLMQSYKKFFN